MSDAQLACECFAVIYNKLLTVAVRWCRLLPPLFRWLFSGGVVPTSWWLLPDGIVPLVSVTRWWTTSRGLWSSDACQVHVLVIIVKWWIASRWILSNNSLPLGYYYQAIFYLLVIIARWFLTPGDHCLVVCYLLVIITRWCTTAWWLLSTSSLLSGDFVPPGDHCLVVSYSLAVSCQVIYCLHFNAFRWYAVCWCADLYLLVIVAGWYTTSFLIVARCWLTCRDSCQAMYFTVW